MPINILTQRIEGIGHLVNKIGFPLSSGKWMRSSYIQQLYDAFIIPFLELIHTPSAISYKITPNVVPLLRTVNWNTKPSISLQTSDEISIRNVINQGDPLSSLWFRLPLNPLSNPLYGSKIPIPYCQNAH